MGQTHLKGNAVSASESWIVVVEVQSIEDTSAAAITECAGSESSVDYCSIGNGPDKLVENNFVVESNVNMRLTANWISLETREPVTVSETSFRLGSHLICWSGTAF